MAKFRKKPVVIEAISFEELVTIGLKQGMPKHIIYNNKELIYKKGGYIIPTLEGNMLMTREDMLITGVDGEIYPCKVEIFLKTYEPVD